MRSIYSENLALEKVDNMATKDGILLVKSQVKFIQFWASIHIFLIITILNAHAICIFIFFKELCFWH